MIAVHTNPTPKPKYGTVVVDWSPRVCGSTAWGGHLRAADRSIELMSFSKSGRPLASWESAFEWQARRISDAAAILNDYDRVILCDVACFAPDVSLDAFGRPYYEKVMADVTRPWTAVFHGGTYPVKHDDTIGAVLSSPGFCGTLVTPRIGQAKSRLAPWPALKFEHHPYLPYDVSQAPKRRDGRGRDHSVLMTSRLSSNKGQSLALELTAQLAGDIHIWGYDPHGRNPSQAWMLWERGQKLGYVGDMPRSRPGAPEYPGSQKYYPGPYELRAPNGKTFNYHLPYRDLKSVDWSPWLHLSLASTDFSGILEYTIVDAVMCGSIAAVPVDFPTEGRYRTCQVFERHAVAQTLNGLLMLSDRKLNEIANAQFAEFSELHKPERTLDAVNRALKGFDKMKKQPLTFTRVAAPISGTVQKPMSKARAEKAAVFQENKNLPETQWPLLALAPKIHPAALPDREANEGSGAYIRRLLALGAQADAILMRVHAQFPGSKATASDVAYNKAKLRKEGVAAPKYQAVEAPTPAQTAKTPDDAAAFAVLRARIMRKAASPALAALLNLAVDLIEKL
jgi:hypothetical protein